MLINIDKAFAQKHLETLTHLIQTIPQTNYTFESVLAEAKEARIFYGKWQRSFALMEGKDLIGCIFGYERQSENSEQYPTHTIYMSELAVRPEYQGRGFGKLLVETWLANNRALGMQEFPDTQVNFSLQTNQALWNQGVRDFYTGFGFKKRAEKIYPDRVDVVMGLTPAV